MKTGRIASLAVALTAAALAQKAPDPSALKQAVALTGTQMYVAPDSNSTPVGDVLPGQVLGLESSTGGFVRAFNGVSGWIPNHGLVSADDPNGAEIVFGAAVLMQAQAEAEASERATAESAARLFARVVDMFPASPRAPEAMFRAADIKWQLELADQPRRRDPSQREFPDDSDLKKVASKYPDTPWAARAEFDRLVEHFTCGELTAKPECIGKEVDVYQEYIKKYPHGPQTAEAAYDVLFDEAVGATIYGGPTHPDAAKAKEYQGKVAADATSLERQYANSDWAAKAALLAFKVSQGTPVYPSTSGGKP